MTDLRLVGAPTAWWERAVCDNGVALWSYLRRTCNSAADAAEIFLLVWFRLELVTRDRDPEFDVLAWLLCEAGAAQLDDAPAGLNGSVNGRHQDGETA